MDGNCFKALGVPSRLKIYKYLKTKPWAQVGDIVNIVKLTQPTVSYHLREMEKLGLLTSTKKGRKVFYQINTVCPKNNKECVLTKVKFYA